MMYYTHVSPSVFDAIREGNRVSLPVALDNVFVGDEMCFKECSLNNGLVTGCFVIVVIDGVQYGLDPEFPIEISWQSPKKGK